MKGKNGKLRETGDFCKTRWLSCLYLNAYPRKELLLWAARSSAEREEGAWEQWLQCQFLIARQTILHAATGRSVKWGVCVWAQLGLQVACLQVLVHILRFCKIRWWRQLLWLWLNTMVSAFHEELVVLVSLVFLHVLLIIRSVQLWCRHCLWTPTLHSTYPSDAIFRHCGADTVLLLCK